MAVSNGLNPKFIGPVTATGYATTHGNGISTTAKSTNGTSAVLLLGYPTVGFSGTITSWHIMNEGATAATISLSVGGVVVSTISMTGSTGAMVGPATVLSPTTFNLGGTVGVYSNSALTQAQAKVFLTYAVLNP